MTKKNAAPGPRSHGDPEADALAVAHRAITSQPSEAWPRMLGWLTSRINSDRCATTGPAGSE